MADTPPFLFKEADSKVDYSLAKMAAILLIIGKAIKIAAVPRHNKGRNF